MDRYKTHGISLDDLKKLSVTDVESAFYPPDNIRRKAEDVMPDFAAIHERIMRDGSKANLYFMWLKYKQEYPSGYQYTQFCHHYNQYLKVSSDYHVRFDNAYYSVDQAYLHKEVFFRASASKEPVAYRSVPSSGELQRNLRMEWYVLHPEGYDNWPQHRRSD